MEFFDSMINSNEGARLSHLRVKFSHEANCWVGLPPRLVSQLYEADHPRPLVLELKPAQGRPVAASTWHVAWSGGVSSSDGLIEISGALAGLLGIQEHSTVSVKALASVPEATQVSVEPFSTDDWEMVEQNAGHMEEQLCNQVGVVSKGHPFIFFVRGRTVLRLKVAAAEPASLVRLVPGAEVAVAPRPRVARQAHRAGPLVPAAAHGEEPENEELPEIWLRVQEQEAGNLLPVMLGAKGGKPAMTTCCAVSAVVNPAAAEQAGLKAMSTVAVSSPKAKGQRVHLAVRISPDAAAGHVILPQSALQQLGVRPSMRVRLQQDSNADSAWRACPQAVLLHPVEPAKGSDARCMPVMTPEVVQDLFAAWLEAQAGSVVPSLVPLAPTEHLSVPDDDCRARAARTTLPMQSGQVMTLQQLGGTPAAPEQPEQAVLLLQGSTSQLLGSGGGASSLSTGRALAIGQTHVEAGAEAGKGASASWQIELKQGFTLQSTLPPPPCPLSAEDVRARRVEVHLSSMKGAPTPEALGPDDFGKVPLAQARDRLRKQAALLQGSAALQRAAAAILARTAPQLLTTSRRALLEAGAPLPGGLLLCGPPGCGKSSLLRLVGDALRTQTDCQAHVVFISCRTVTADGWDALHKHLTPLVRLLREALECMPSLLVFDDLHLLCPSASEGPENPADDMHAGVASWLCDVLASFRLPGRQPLPVAVCATCPEPAAILAELRAPGRLDHVVRVPAPGPAERISMMAAGLLAAGATFDIKDLKALADTAEGYDAADMHTLLERVLHAAVTRRLRSRLPAAAQTLHVSSQDFKSAQSNFQPASAWGVGHQRKGQQAGLEGWQDVGGMQEVRAALREALELPTKYARLVARAPLRLRTGVLLYGPPGCGKTHVVAAAVAAAGMRFVSVKGPEVLNKYIGASEAAVRDLFRRAQAAAPCVLFFDEFDAIAPSRGHDNTGVTDRVVNQLLTELDGVEGLKGTTLPGWHDTVVLWAGIGLLASKGVCVLAATSRPDLLDAALLRPGRLDRLIYCDFPGTDDRLEILTALSRRSKLDNDVDLRAVAEATEGFTGADLSALLSEAQLLAVHEMLDAAAAEGAKEEEEKAPLLEGRHFEVIMQMARPSVTQTERTRLESIYSKFKDSRDSGIGNTSKSRGKGKQRATLA